MVSELLSFIANFCSFYGRSRRIISSTIVYISVAEPVVSVSCNGIFHGSTSAQVPYVESKAAGSYPTYSRKLRNLEVTYPSSLLYKWLRRLSSRIKGLR
ncbi:hypothetical protein MA16_Dca028104 [Dendrobium catenatum]|uniref:Uncharacterized protein n=1 Tax=Dendrobium catenatum TaxID=906689 RepID=A0A2I0VDZ4_9ASPA|nr:hypothetical protein MA16_Dca028104 [Dendrobium catenatum]